MVMWLHVVLLHTYIPLCGPLPPRWVVSLVPGSERGGILPRGELHLQSGQGVEQKEGQDWAHVPGPMKGELYKRHQDNALWWVFKVEVHRVWSCDLSCDLMIMWPNYTLALRLKQQVKGLLVTFLLTISRVWYDNLWGKYCVRVSFCCHVIFNPPLNCRKMIPTCAPIGCARPRFLDTSHTCCGS